MKPTVFVTGGTRNTGLAVARKFAKEGYAVCLTSRKKEDAERVAKALRQEFSVKTKGYGVDLKNVAEIRACFQDVKESFGGLSVFVSVAADIALNVGLLDATEARFDEVMATNIKGTFFCTQEAAKLMIPNKKGAIVLFDSVQGHGGVRNRVLYGTSKGSVEAFVKMACYELSEYGIRINAVVPGAIRTDRWNGISDEEVARRRSNWPLRESEPEDIANAVYFLASDEARTVTGTELAVDSGVMACLLKYDGGVHQDA